MMKKKINNQGGLTFLEVIVTMAIIGLLLAIALPNYADITRRIALNASAQTLVKAFATARVEAVSAPQAASTVCWDFRPVGQFPNPDPLPGALGGQTIDAGEIIVYRNTLLGATEIISATQLLNGRQSLVITNVVNPPNDCVSFDSQGRLTNNGGANPLGFLLCRQMGGADNTNSIRVEVNASGRVLSKDNSFDTTGLGTQACI